MDPFHVRTSATGQAKLPLLHFARHQTYPLRASWIAQGLQALVATQGQPEAAYVFAFPAATERFGMEPAMVQALRFWLRATGLLVELPGRGARRIPTLTPLGHLLARVDPHLEHCASVWLLHAHLARNLHEAPAFSWFFQCFGRAPFTKEACVQALRLWTIKQAPTQQISPNTLSKEIECLLAMYLPSRLLSPEHHCAASPFQRLGLLTPLIPHASVSSKSAPICYGWQPPRMENVPALVVLAILLEQAGKRVPLREVLDAPMHVGRTFGLSSDRLWEIFTSLRAFAPAWCPTVEKIGRLEWVTVPNISVDQVLGHYYGCP